MIFELAHALGLVPLLWLVGLRARGKQRDAAFWWVAIAFGVSFLADTVAHWITPSVVGNVYTLLQASLIGLVLLDRGEAVAFAGLLLAASLMVAGIDPGGRDLILSTAAWLGVAVIAYRIRSPFRRSLLATFGGGWVAWCWYAADPGWASWLAYQGTRAVGTGLFCWAAYRPRVRLTLHRNDRMAA